MNIFCIFSKIFTNIDIFAPTLFSLFIWYCVPSKCISSYPLDSYLIVPNFIENVHKPISNISNIKTQVLAPVLMFKYSRTSFLYFVFSVRTRPHFVCRPSWNVQRQKPVSTTILSFFLLMKIKAALNFMSF